MDRPVGVTVIAVLFFCTGAIGAVSALVGLLGASFIAGVLSVHGQGGAGLMGATLAVVAAVAGVVNLLMSPVAVVVGWGLLKLKGWARIVVFVFAGLETLGTLFGLAGGWAHYFGPFAMLGNLARALLVGRLAIAGWIVWYLLQPSVKAAFDRGQKITA